MSYWPVVKSANHVAGSKLGEKHTVILFDAIVSDGAVEYAFLVGVFDNETQKPVYFVSSEVNKTAKEFGGGSHFMGAFDGQGHLNFGSSNDWGDPKKFFPAALKKAAEHFGVKLGGA